MFVANKSHLVVHRNGESRIEHHKFQQMADFESELERSYVLSIPLAARVESIMPCACTDVGSFQLIRANALERAVGFNRVQVLTDPRAEKTIQVDGLLLAADGEKIVVGDEEGGITVLDQSDVLTVKVLNASDLASLLRYTQHNGWAMAVDANKPFKFSYQLSMPTPPEVLLDVRYTKSDGMKLVRWVALESPFSTDNVLVTVVESMDDRRPVERERMEYRTMAVSTTSAAPPSYDDSPPEPESARPGFADEYRQDAIKLSNIRAGHNRVRLPDLTTGKVKLIYIAELKAAQTAQVQRQPYRRLSWESDDFVFSGYASVSVHGEDVQRVWFDAWKHPTCQWIDLPGSNAVVVHRQVHSQRTTQEGVELVVRIEVYNRTDETVDVMVQEFMPKNAGTLEQAGEEWAHGGGMPVQEMRLGAEKLDFEYSKQAKSDKGGWNPLEPPLLFDGTYWRKAVNPETGVAESSTWELKMEDIPPKSGRLFLYKTMKA